jgi:hypothetical protein
MSFKMQRILKPFHHALMSGPRADIDCMHIAQYEVVGHNSDNAVSGFHSPWGMGNLGNLAVRGLLAPALIVTEAQAGVLHRARRFGTASFESRLTNAATPHLDLLLEFRTYR